MITRINAANNIYKPVFTASEIIQQTPNPQDMVDITVPSDVKDNFTFNRVADNLTKKLNIDGATVLNGKTYGIDYELYRNGFKYDMDITGHIGKKQVEVKRYKKDIFGLQRNIVGYVGDKKINLTESTGFDNVKVKGKFGNEEIDFKIYQLRADKIYTGRGIDMMEQYSYAPSKIYAGCKYHGQYRLDPEFLPILAALNRAY